METVFKVGSAVAGAAASFLFGGWSVLIQTLMAFVIVDYVSGVIAGAKEGKLNSYVGLLGISRKVLIFALVAVAHMVDMALGEGHMFRDAAIFFYLANELLSILENASRIGVPIPPKVKEAVEVLRGKDDKH
ncbi:phage holin family protein [Melghirimyces algeriensis]|uniref:Toxin secretion/phage lysis holin n=1 Tax=Melghirimyces algeriensis TaxID=910412 RepID=A0A521C741_9BACL|nr:phage holin family protein [Melghirimyces algeriensis]SMO55185.1 toxin secretion/phage lysis holin [Melghirimyces algeriensis]